jgi:ubiquinone/menaquinone biosynthesis C-methylase UbiE
MLHHLAANAKLPALREMCRVLKPGRSLHVADFAEGGHGRGLHGVLASILHLRRGVIRRPLVLDLMRDAGLPDSQEVAQQASALGRIVYYRAVADRETRSP